MALKNCDCNVTFTNSHYITIYVTVEYFDKKIISLSNFLIRNSDFSLLTVNSFWFSFLCDSELNVLGSGQGNLICIAQFIHKATQSLKVLYNSIKIAMKKLKNNFY